MKFLNLAALILLAIPAFAADKDNCYRGDGAFQQKINGFAVAVEKVPMAKAIGASTPLSGCRATVTDPQGKVIFKAIDYGIGLALGGDTQLDGEPGVVFESYSGGAHCCWTYYFVSLGKESGVIAKLPNQQGIGFEKNKDGQLLMRAQDGAFDYFDGLCHACTVFPTVFFELKGKRFVNVSSEHLDAYDKLIADARGELKPDRLAAFLKVPKIDNQTRIQYMDTIPPVLTIVFSYLYSGREAEAWKTLDEMWPPNDRARLKKLILDTREKGILSKMKAS